MIEQKINLFRAVKAGDAITSVVKDWYYGHPYMNQIRIQMINRIYIGNCNL